MTQKSMPLDHELVVRQMELFHLVTKEATREQKDRAGFLWLQKVLKVDEATIARFLGEGYNTEANQAIGMKHANMLPVLEQADVIGFWQGVQEAMPENSLMIQT